MGRLEKKCGIGREKMERKDPFSAGSGPLSPSSRHLSPLGSWSSGHRKSCFPPHSAGEENDTGVGMWHMVAVCMCGNMAVNPAQTFTRLQKVLTAWKPQRATAPTQVRSAAPQLRRLTTAASWGRCSLSEGSPGHPHPPTPHPRRLPPSTRGTGRGLARPASPESGIPPLLVCMLYGRLWQP